MNRKMPFLLLPALLLLAGCNWFQADGDGNDSRSADGDVLKGSISDAMIPLDTLRSQAPVMKPSPGEASDDGAGGDDDSAVDDADSDAGEGGTATEEPAGAPEESDSSE